MSSHYFSLKQLIDRGDFNRRNFKGKGRSKGPEGIYTLPSTKFKKGPPAFVKCELFSWAKELANVPQNYNCEMPDKSEQKKLENSIIPVASIINSSRNNMIERFNEDRRRNGDIFTILYVLQAMKARLWKHLDQHQPFVQTKLEH